MPFGSADLTEVGIVAEATFGVTPAGAVASVPHTGISMSPTLEQVNSNTLTAFRIRQAVRLGFRGGQGELPFELRYGDYDPFMEMVMGKAWTADQLVTGGAILSKTLEMKTPAINLYEQYVGVVASTFALSINADSTDPITGSFGLIAQDFNAAAAPLSANYTAPTQNEPMTAGDCQVTLDGVTNQTFVSVALNLTNTIVTPRTIGRNTVREFVLGKQEVSGTIVFYVEDDSWLDRAKNEVVAAVAAQCLDPAGNEILFELPKIKVVGISTDRSGGPIRCTGQITAFDPAQLVNLRMTRTPV